MSEMNSSDGTGTGNGQLTDRTGAPVEVRLLPDGETYGLFFPGGSEPVGRAHFLDRTGADGVAERVFHHTVVGEEFGGRGLAGVLVSRALDEARDRGLRVVPVCSYVAGWIRKNNWDGPVAPVTDEVEDWVADQA